ncbi:MAG TPA: M20/M25/M40 family metallo-hydrolase [Clostridia bacterium]|nr:M20/M25/M40 family metallo-hydrolase [Clostridia bacterium]
MEFINKSKVIDLLSQLIEIESIYLEEEDIMKFVHKYLKDHKLDSKIQEYSEKEILDYDGKNVIGSLEGKGEGPVIYLNGHLDTVQLTKGWTTDPLKPVIKGNKMYGLGALDMKSGVVAIILALQEFDKNYKDFNGKILYSFVSDEEGPFGLGTDAVINSGFTDNANIAIITEPSSGFSDIPFPCLALGARGGFSYTVEFFGKAAHGANPEQGVSAILSASKFALGIKSVELADDHELGPGSNCIIEINGGGATCSVADYAYVKVFRHINTEENRESVIKEIKETIMKSDIPCDYEISFRKAPSDSTDGFLPYVFKKSDDYVGEFIESIKAVSGKEPTLNHFSSIGDFNYVGSRLNIPTLVFGPNGKNYHSPDEYVLIDSVVKTSEVLYDFFKKMLL